MYRKGNQCL